MSNKKVVAWALYVLVIGDIATIVITGLRKEWLWFSFFIANTALVLGFEIGRYLVAKKTISKTYGEWGQRDKFWAILVLALFWINMTALVVHLGAYFL